MPKRLPVLLLALLCVACGQEQGASSAGSAGPATATESGLEIRTLKNGHGRAAVVGDTVTVHYTGWLYDETAADKRGEQFDSSHDPGRSRFQFTLGEGRVIPGWEQGVAGMLIGETRELVIPPELAYGDRGAGGVIPPGATLVFEVELFAARGAGD